MPQRRHLDLAPRCQRLVHLREQVPQALRDERPVPAGARTAGATAASSAAASRARLRRGTVLGTPGEESTNSRLSRPTSKAR